MKLTKKTVKWFEQEQKEWGTKTALYNLIWTIAADMMTDIGVRDITTRATGDGKKTIPVHNYPGK